MQAPIELSNSHLAISLSLVLVILAAVRAWKLDLEQQYLIATVRTVAQLLLLGTVLGWVFDHASVWLVMGVLVVFVFVATRTAVGRQSIQIPGLSWNVAISLTSAAGLLTILVTAFVIQVSPWWTPQYLIPLAGMILANSMNTAALTLERLRSELGNRAGEVEELLSLGASARQAVEPSARAALRAAIMPNLNQMLVVGLVSIPGTMTGQILTGLPPGGAARYQILVMLLWNAGASSTCALLVWLTYPRFFTDAVQLRHELLERT